MDPSRNVPLTENGLIAKGCGVHFVPSPLSLCKRASIAVPIAIKLAASPKLNTGETTVHSTPMAALEMNFAVPLTVPSAPRLVPSVS